MVLDRLSALGLTLPPAPAPIGAYTPAVRAGHLLFLSGQLPLISGQLLPEYTGKLGADVSLEHGQHAARQATLNALAIIEEAVRLTRVVRIVRLAGHIASDPSFFDQPKVLNAASELLGELFGERGIHSRVALGAAVLPLNACVELELIVEFA